MYQAQTVRAAGRFFTCSILFSSLLILLQLRCSSEENNPVSNNKTSRIIGKTAVFVVGSKTLSAGDLVLKDKLTSTGLTVTLKDGDSISSRDTGYSLIVISGSVNPLNIGGLFKSAGKPVICLHPALYSSMAMTGGRAGTDYGYTTGSSITVPVPNSSTDTILGDGQSGSVTVSSGSDSLGWGVPNANADTVATTAGGKYAIFGYNKAASMMGGFTAPARRVGLFMYNSAAANATSAGTSLFGKAISWALNLQDLNVRPVISLSTPRTGSRYLLCDSIVLSATATDADGSVQLVRFTSNDTVFDSASTSPYRVVMRNFSVAKICTLQAIAIDDSNGVGQSALSVVTIRHVVPTVTVTTPTANSLYKLFDTVTITARVADSDKTLDSVIFYDSSSASSTWHKLDSQVVTDSVTKGIYTTRFEHLSAGVYKVKVRTVDRLDSTRTSTSIVFNVRNRVPSIAITYPTANTLFKMYDTLRMKVKCFDSNKTLDTIIFYDSVAGGSLTPVDTLAVSDSTAGGYYTMSRYDTLKTLGTHYLKAKVWDRYDSTRTSATIAVSVRNRVPSIAITYPTANKLFKIYDTLKIKLKCFDSNKTLDTIVFYDSVAGGSLTPVDTLTASDSTAGGYYTMSRYDTLKTLGTHYLKAKVWDIYDSTRTSATVAVSVRNRVPSIAVTYPTANKLFRMYDTLRVKVKCFDSNKTLDTIIIYDSLAGGSLTPIDTMTAADSTAGGYYTMGHFDTLKTLGNHYIKATVWDIYDSTRTSTIIPISVRNRVPSIAITYPTANKLFKMYDTLKIKVKCFDSNKTLDTIVFYDSVAGGSLTPVDTLTASDSTAGGYYTMSRYDTLKTLGTHYLKAKVWDIYDSTRTSATVAVSVRNRVPYIAVTYPTANKLFRMYDTLRVKVKCFDSNKTLDTIIIYDSTAGGSLTPIDTMTAADSTAGGYYTMGHFDTLKTLGNHYIKATVWDIYDSTRTSTIIPISVRNRVPSIAITYPTANKLFKMYDTLRIKVRCFDSNKTLDTVIFYDSVAGGSLTPVDTLTASDSTAGGYYTMSRYDTLKTLGTHYLKAKVWDIYDSTRTSATVAISVRNRVPSIAITYPAANTLFKMYDTLRIKVKCFDSNKTLDTVIFYDSVAGGSLTPVDTLTASDSTAGGYYTMSRYDTLKTLGTHYLKVKVWDIYDSMRTSATVAVSVRNRVPSIAVTYPTANKLFRMYDTLRVKVKCFDSNKTLDTIIIYDSLAGGSLTPIDTMTAADSTAGGYYTMGHFDTLKTLGNHYIKATVWDIYDSTRTSTTIPISVRNRVPSIAITYPAANTLFKMYDTLRIKVKCFDSNKTLDTVVFYDSVAGGSLTPVDTLTASDSTTGGYYTMSRYDTLKTLGTHYLKAKVWDIYDSTRTSTTVAISVRNRVPSIAITYPAANTLFKMYDTLRIKVKCFDSNKTLDTIIIYDSLAGGSLTPIDTMTAADSTAGGYYTMAHYDTLKAQGTHYLKATVWDIYDSTRTSSTIAVTCRNRVPSVVITSPANNTEFVYYDTIKITARIVDSNKTLDTIIFYDSLAGGTKKAVDTLTAADSTTYQIYKTANYDTLRPGGTHYLWAKVWDIYDSTRTSAMVAAIHDQPTATVVATPTYPTADGMTLSWTAVSDAGFASYKIYYSASASVDTNSTLYGTITNKNVTSISLSGLSTGTFYIKVYVFDMAGQFTASNEVTGSTDP